MKIKLIKVVIALVALVSLNQSLSAAVDVKDVQALETALEKDFAKPIEAANKLFAGVDIANLNDVTLGELVEDLTEQINRHAKALTVQKKIADALRSK